MQDASPNVTPIEAALGESAAAPAAPLPKAKEAARKSAPGVGQDAVDLPPPNKGDRDHCGDIVGKIYVKNSHFMIYTTGNDGEFGRLRYHFFGAYEDTQELRRHINPTMVLIAQITDILCGVRANPKGLLPVFRRTSKDAADKDYEFLVERCRAFMARAMQMSLEARPDLAERMLETLRKELEARRDSRNRMRYIFANAATLAAIFLSFLLVTLTQSGHGAIHLLFAGGVSDAAGVEALYLDVLMFGAIGAFFSVSIGLKDVRIDHSITLFEVFYAGVVRLVIGIIAATIVILMIEGKWFPLNLGDPPNAWIYCLLGFIAGFSELFVPNMLKQMETRARPRASGGIEGEAPAKERVAVI